MNAETSPTTAEHGSADVEHDSLEARVAELSRELAGALREKEEALTTYLRKLGEREEVDVARGSCAGCGLAYGSAFWKCDLDVPSAIWAQITPSKSPQGGLLCPNCTLKRIAEARGDGRLPHALDIPCAINGNADTLSELRSAVMARVGPNEPFVPKNAAALLVTPADDGFHRGDPCEKCSTPHDDQARVRPGSSDEEHDALDARVTEVARELTDAGEAIAGWKEVAEVRGRAVAAATLERDEARENVALLESRWDECPSGLAKPSIENKRLRAALRDTIETCDYVMSGRGTNGRRPSLMPSLREGVRMARELLDPDAPDAGACALTADERAFLASTADTENERLRVALRELVAMCENRQWPADGWRLIRDARALLATDADTETPDESGDELPRIRSTESDPDVVLGEALTSSAGFESGEGNDYE